MKRLLIGVVLSICLFASFKLGATTASYNATVQIVDSVGNILGGIASAVTASPNYVVRVVDSTNKVLDSVGPSGPSGATGPGGGPTGATGATGPSGATGATGAGFDGAGTNSTWVLSAAGSPQTATLTLKDAAGATITAAQQIEIYTSDANGAVFMSDLASSLTVTTGTVFAALCEYETSNGQWGTAASKIPACGGTGTLDFAEIVVPASGVVVVRCTNTNNIANSYVARLSALLPNGKLLISAALNCYTP